MSSIGFMIVIMIIGWILNSFDSRLRKLEGKE